MYETHNKISVKVIEFKFDNLDCSQCAFEAENISCAMAKCRDWEREDGKNVYFVKVKNTISRERITELAIQNGFKLKTQTDGVDALNPYVFDFVFAILNEVK